MPGSEFGQNIRAGVGKKLQFRNAAGTAWVDALSLNGSDVPTFAGAVTATTSITATTSVNAGTTITATAGDITATNGNMIMSTAGKGLKVKEGSNARMGSATLTSGTVTVSNTSVTANTRIYLSRYAANGSTAIGALSVGTVSASTSFVISALAEADGTTKTGDTSIVHWFLVEPAS